MIITRISMAGARGVAAQLIRQLADPRPKGVSVTKELGAYRNLAVRWTDWGEVLAVCRQLAAEMLEAEVESCGTGIPQSGYHA